MATRRKNTLPVPAHVQALIDALEALRPAHWTACHGTGSSSSTWMIYSEVFRARIDDLKLADEKGRAGYRVGVEVALIDGRVETCFNLYDNPMAARRFKASFHRDLLRPLKDCIGHQNVMCGAYPLKQGKAKLEWNWKTGQASHWIDQWLSDPAYFDLDRLSRFQLAVGLCSWDSCQELIELAAPMAAAYLPLLECMVPLEGEPISARRLTRLDPLKQNLSRVVGKPEQVGCECHRIAGLHSQTPCAGRLEAAHIHPYQHGGSGDADNGLWLCHAHHCETEGRIKGSRSLGVQFQAHILQQRRSRLAPNREAMG